MATRIILDTDIGTDVDDCLALALVLSSPELELLGVTCVYADVLLRARMVLKLLSLAGRSDVPVTVGVRRPLLDLVPVFWSGHEGEGLLTPDDDALLPSPEHSVDYIVRTVMESPGEIHLVAIGPLTNVALALLREPELARNLAGLTIMGGAARSRSPLELPYREHNFACDPEAAHIVLTSGAPITLIPLDVTTQVRIQADGVQRIRSGGTPFHEAVAQQVELYPGYRSRGFTHLHDPLAVATLLIPDIVTLHPMHVDVELGGRHATAATLMRTPSDGAPLNAQVALDVHAERFETFLTDRVSTALDASVR